MALVRRICNGFHLQQMGRFGTVGRNLQRHVSNPGQYSTASSEGESSFQEDPSADNPRDEDSVKSEILNMALNFVNTKGWNVNSISAAAEEMNLAPSVSGIFSDYDLVHFFIQKNNLELESHLSQNELKFRDALEWRLRKVVPYIAGYSEAVAIAAQPQNLRHSIPLLQQMADTVAFHSLTDTSTDINWYTKRVGIAAVYMSTEMCLIQDKSDGQQETWKFLDRRVKEFEKLKKGEISLPAPEVLHAGLTTLKNILGRNASR